MFTTIATLSPLKMSIVTNHWPCLMPEEGLASAPAGWVVGISDHHHVTTKILIPGLKVDAIKHILHFHTVTL